MCVSLRVRPLVSSLSLPASLSASIAISASRSSRHTTARAQAWKRHDGAPRLGAHPWAIVDLVVLAHELLREALRPHRMVRKPCARTDTRTSAALAVSSAMELALSAVVFLPRALPAHLCAGGVVVGAAVRQRQIDARYEARQTEVHQWLRPRAPLMHQKQSHRCRSAARVPGSALYPAPSIAGTSATL